MSENEKEMLGPYNDSRERLAALLRQRGLRVYPDEGFQYHIRTHIIEIPNQRSVHFVSERSEDGIRGVHFALECDSDDVMAGLDRISCQPWQSKKTFIESQPRS